MIDIPLVRDILSNIKKDEIDILGATLPSTDYLGKAVDELERLQKKEKRVCALCTKFDREERL